MHGSSTSAVEVANISPHGFWLLLEGRERFIAFDRFPWFREATIGQLCDVVDLDGPIYFAGDRDKTIVYKDGEISVADDVWGATA